MNSLLIATIITLSVGVLLGVFIYRSISEKNKKVVIDREAHELVLQERDKLNTEIHQLRKNIDDKSNALVRVETEAENLNKKLLEERNNIEKIRMEMRKDFELMVNCTLEEKSKIFKEGNREQLYHILNPLAEKIKDFEEKVTRCYENEQNERISLKAKIESLTGLNKKLSEDAENLTKALKGDVKTLGNWGELILERILENSGLIKGREYEVQPTYTNEDGRRLQPDVVVHLPDNKKVIIDSKVSLLAYESYVASNNREEADANLKKHLTSLRTHVRNLSDKHYENLLGENSLDFVLLFVPIEPAFLLTVQHDTKLFQEAFNKRIIIVSNSTLLATLRTIYSIWKAEHQNRNALEISRQATRMMEKFVNFTDALTRIGHYITQTQNAYDNALKKINGRDNLISQAKKIEQLGIDTKKQINEEIYPTFEKDTND